MAIKAVEEVRLLELLLRFPGDAAPGGNIRTTQWAGGTSLGETGFALTEAEAEAIRAALAETILGILRARGVVNDTAKEATPIAPVRPTEPPQPESTLGRLG